MNGARFALMDAQGETVWELNLPRDYTVAGDENAMEKIYREIHRDGAILDGSQKNRFSLRFVAANQKVTFEVRPAENKTWAVAEIARGKWEEQNPAENQQEFPRLSLRPLRSVSLLDTHRRLANPIRDIERFALDAEGRIGFLRFEPDRTGPTFVLVNDLGQVVWSVNLEGLRLSTEYLSSADLAWIGGNRFLLTLSGFRDGGKAKAWWIDVELKRVTAIPRFVCPSVQSLAGFHDGRFLVLSGRRESVHLFGADGTERCVFAKQSDPTPGVVFSPIAVTFTSDGNVAIAHRDSAFLSIFAPDGAHRKTIDLAQAWQRSPIQLFAMANDPHGGFLVTDFQSRSPVVRMDDDATILEEFLASYPGGKMSAKLQYRNVSTSLRPIFLICTEGVHCVD